MEHDKGIRDVHYDAGHGHNPPSRKESGPSGTACHDPYSWISHAH